VPPRMRPDLRSEVAGSRERLDHLVRIDVRVWEHVARRALPDADLPSTLEASVQRAVERYGAMLQEPDGTPPARRAIERLYEVGIRLDPRRRLSRR
jgi:hypothetical protein